MMPDETSSGQDVARRELLQTGLAAATIGALGGLQTGAATQAKERGPGAIDIHAHYFPQPYLDLLGEEGQRYGLPYRPAPDGFFIGEVHYARKFTDLELRVADMDARGVSVQALSLTAPMLYFAEPGLAYRLARAWNDAASAAHVAYRDRFVGLITLPMGDPDRAIDELTRANTLPGMRGVYLGTNIEDRDLDDPRFAPVFARIEQRGLPVFLHPLKTVGGERLKPYYLSNLIGNPVDTAIAAAHLICGGVLDRFPKLEVCLPHSGGVMPILMGRWDRGAQIRPELKSLKKPPSAYLKRFTYDTVCHSKAVLRFVIAEVGVERIMLGSDYCFDMGYDRPVEVVTELGLDPNERAQILHGTAARLLKL
jgi:aminocarboxymuconate-semialdehyde decarboxylase